MKLLIKIILFGGIIIVGFLLFSFLYHNYQLRIEAEKYPPPGKLVEVNGHKMHVFTEGNGEITLVFMAGGGTSNPTIDFKPLWMKLTDKYRIAVVEKAGYGWSETSSNSRDVDIMLEETRKALRQSGEEGPYVLVAHSLSGLEAIYWGQKYPNEIQGIIGLDMAVPDVYLDSSFELPSSSELNIMYLISRIGLSRFMSRKNLDKNFPLLKSDELSKEDKEKFISLFYKSSYTKNMLNEVDYIKENATKVKSKKVPINIPMYFFIAEDNNINIVPSWEKNLSEYISKINSGKKKLLDCGHYMHHEKSEIIADEIKKYIISKNPLKLE